MPELMVPIRRLVSRSRHTRLVSNHSVDGTEEESRFMKRFKVRNAVK